MNYFVRNVVLFHVFALALAFSWIHGGTRPDLLLPVIPWLAAFALEFLLVFPQAKKTETLAEARLRVWRALARDPLLYAALALTILLVIPLFNVAGAPVFDEAAKHWVNPRPPLPGLPSCVNPDEHAVVLLWFPPALIAALAARHGLLKKGKRILFEGLCWNGAALALLGLVQQATGAKSIFWGNESFSQFFSTFGYPNFAGAFFTLMFALSAGLWFSRASVNFIGISAGSGTRLDNSSLVEQHYLLVAVVLNLVAAFASLSRAAIVLSAITFLVLSAYMIAGVWQKAARGGKVLLSMAIGIIIFLIALSVTIFAPKALKSEIATITPTAVFDRVAGHGYYHTRVAKEIYRDHPTFGVGGWGYPHYLMQYLSPDEVKSMQIEGGANVHNDSLQFLAEQGIVGYSLMLVCVLFLVMPLLIQGFKTCRAAARVDVEATPPPKPVFLYRLPPPLVAVFIGACATVCHSLGDLPFRNPAVLTMWVLAFVCATGFLPAVRKTV